MKRTIGLLAVIAIAACSQRGSSGTATTSTTASTAAATPGTAVTPGAAMPSVSFDDISAIAERRYIEDIGALGVFDMSTGSFNPSGTISRAEYVRWLVRANNAIWFDQPSLQIRPAEGPPATFPDVPQSQRNFAYIQGIDNAGFAIGFRDKRFHPNELLTHEQLLAIKESVDRGGYDHIFAPGSLAEGNWSGQSWKDRDRVTPDFRPLIATLVNDDKNAGPGHGLDTIGRTFGAIAMLRPQMPATRAQAAASLWNMGAHRDLYGPPTPRTAAEALRLRAATPAPRRRPPRVHNNRGSVVLRFVAGMGLNIDNTASTAISSLLLVVLVVVFPIWDVIETRRLRVATDVSARESYYRRIMGVEWSLTLLVIILLGWRATFFFYAPVRPS